MNKLPGFGLVERARALAPLIAREADEIERTRRLTQPVVAALIENGLYRVLLPQSADGTEAPPEIFMQMLEEVAKADASTAWCLGQCSVCAMIAAYLDADAARQIFGSPGSILAWGAIAGEAHVVPGGYRATGRWNFASGSRQASWLGAHVQIVEADGTRRRKPDGAPEVRTILFPLASATMYDVWDVIGLRGTGTNSYSVENLFIPEKFTALRDEPAARARNGAALPAHHPHRFRVGLCRGLARRRAGHARRRGRTGARQGVGRHQGDAREQCGAGRDRAHRGQSARRARLSLCHRRRGLARSDAGYRKYTEEHRVALRLASTWTIHQAASVVDAAYHMAGATAVFSANKFERRFRDMHAIAQQIQARDTHYEDVGRAILATGSPRAPPMDA